MNIFVKHIKYYTFGRRIKNHPTYIGTQKKNELELAKRPNRTDIINYLLSQFNRETIYLEIGVRNPDDNYTHIKSHTKYSVDPGIEFEANPVDFKMTSDVFFEQLGTGQILSKDIKFDVIFVDGMHTALQVDKDIENALTYLSEDGFLVLHDCNPITEWHERDDYSYIYTPAGWCWSGSTWKAYLKWRSVAGIQSCCIDTDWGVGVLSRKYKLGQGGENKNEFYEYSNLSENREEQLNLISFEEMKKRIEQN